ncbi:hypothetical protein J416_08247, partial [Gracilibacillus halophilus YIM-C55.5]
VVYLTKWIPEHTHSFILGISEQFNQIILPIFEKVMEIINGLTSEQQLLLQEQLEEFSISIADQMASLLETTLRFTGNQLATLPGSLTMIVFSLLCTFFLCKDWDKFYRSMIHHSPTKLVEICSDMYQQIRVTLFRYFKAQLMLISISGLIIFIGFIILQIKHALTISFLLCLIDLLPILGTGLVFVPWIAYLFFSGQIPLAIGIAVIYLLVILQRQLLEPKMVSEAIGIHPILTILSIYVGFQLIGFTGLWVGPACLFLMKACMDASVFQHMIQFIKGHPSSSKNGNISTINHSSKRSL